MKRIGIIAMLMLSLTLVVSCTDNSRVKNFGGTATIELEENKKLVNVTWKETELWILTREAREGEVSENYSFKEHSSYGVIEGTYKIKEKITVQSSSVENTDKKETQYYSSYDPNVNGEFYYRTEDSEWKEGYTTE